MFATFKSNAEAANAEVHRVESRAEALRLVLENLRAEKVADESRSYAVWADCPFLEGLDRNALTGAFPGLRFEVSRELAAAARVGISQMDWAIVNTGTVAQDATAVEQRLVSTLPATHIALVASDRLVPDLAALLTVLGPRQSNYISLITGPSRTADIERVLTIGAHGPKRLIIILVDELGETHE